MQTLSDLFPQIAGSVRQDLLCASFIFPRTESLSWDEPAISIEVETLNFNHIQQRIGNEPEAIVLGVCEDLSLILGVIKEAAGELCLDKFDCIQLCCSDQAVLHICATGPPKHQQPEEWL
jgi:hypothetical protein